MLLLLLLLNPLMKVASKMTTLKMVYSMNEIELIKNSCFKVNEKSYVINQNGEIFSCLGQVSYQIVNTRLGKEKIEIVLTCSNRQLVAFIR
jgi:hypothetical protein